MKNAIAGVIAVVLIGCAGSSSSSGSSSSTSAASTWSDTDMQTLVATRCATSSCHGGAQKPSYASISESAMLADTAALAEVKAGKMPRNASLTDAEYATFLAFYGSN